MPLKLHRFQFTLRRTQRGYIRYVDITCANVTANFLHSRTFSARAERNIKAEPHYVFELEAILFICFLLNRLKRIVSQLKIVEIKIQVPPNL